MKRGFRPFLPLWGTEGTENLFSDYEAPKKGFSSTKSKTRKCVPSVPHRERKF